MADNAQSQRATKIQQCADPTEPMHDALLVHQPFNEEPCVDIADDCQLIDTSLDGTQEVLSNHCLLLGGNEKFTCPGIFDAKACPKSLLYQLLRKKDRYLSVSEVSMSIGI
jgi:hypothetical protein